MLYDRPYMRAETTGRAVPYLYWFLGILVGAFVLQMMLQTWFGLTVGLQDWLGLSVGSVLSFKVWTLGTYSLLHGGFGHILGNGLGIFFLGRALIPEIGHKRLTQLCVAMIFGGGLLWFLIHLFIAMPTVLIGASAASMGLLVLFCLMHPNQPITLLLFFVLPLTFQPKWLLWITLAINGGGFLFAELPPIFGVAPLMNLSPVGWSAHLGGMLVGYLYFRFGVNTILPSWMPRRRVKVEPPKWMHKKKATATSKRPFKLNLTNRAVLRKEVDRILDKINHEGFGALTPEEREILEQAKDMLNK